MMRTISCAFLGAALLGMSAPALADPEVREEVEETPPAPADWSVGLGVGIGALMFGTGEGGVLGSGGVPFFVHGIERRVARGTWVTLDAHGSFHSSHDETFGDSSSWNLGGDVGLRQVLNPEDSFRVSIQAAAGVGYVEAYYDSVVIDGVPAGRVHDVGWYAGVRAGIGLEQDFTDHIGMRLSVGLLNASYHETHGETVSSGFGASVGFLPELDLRFRW